MENTNGTNVPLITIDDNGVKTPGTDEILAGVLMDFNQAFGGNLNIESVSSPQAYLSQELTANIVAMNEALAHVFNSVDPAYSSGRMQDAIARIYFLTRKPATHTRVLATISGLAGTVVPAGAIATNSEKNEFRLVEAFTIPETGSGGAWFEAVEAGAVACAAGSLIHIGTNVDGWETVTNKASGAVGNPVENRENFELRRWESVAVNSTGTNAAMRGAVGQLEGVTDVYVDDNYTGKTVRRGVTDYELLPHSLYVCVEGGDDYEVARAIWTKKNVGCDMNGNTNITVVDTTTDTNPEYLVTFNRPTHVEIYFLVTMSGNTAMTAADVAAGVVSVFNGLEGMRRAGIGSTILAARYYDYFNETKNARLVSVKVRKGDGEFSDFVEMGIDEMPVCSVGNVSITYVNVNGVR